MQVQQDLILHTRILKPTFLCYEQLIENVMFTISDRTVAHFAMIELSCKYFSQNTNNRLAIEKFARTYQSTQAAYWYTKDSFIHRITNKVLRTGNIEHGTLLRSYITHLSEQLYKLKYQQQKDTRVTGTHTILYRGLRQSNAHLEILRNLVGHVILTKSFMSTSRDRQIALFYAATSHPQSLQSQPLLIEIHVDMVIPDIIAADVTHVSNFPNEREVLFDIGSQFQVESLTYDSTNLIWHCQLRAMSNESSIIQLSRHMSPGERCVDLSAYSEEDAKLVRIMHQERQEKFSFINNDQENDSLWRNSPSVSWIAIDVADRARILQQKALNHWHRHSDLHHFRSECEHTLDLFKQETDETLIENNDIACVLNNLGHTSQRLGETELGISLLKKAFKIRDRLGASEHFRAQCLRNLGLAYTDQGDYTNAFASLSQALILGQQAPLTAQWSTSLTLRNFGYFYHMGGDYRHAMECFSKALQTFEKCVNFLLNGK